MRHSLKTIIALLLCVVMLSTTILTSCDSGDSGGVGNQGTSQSTPSDNTGDNSSQNKPSDSKPDDDGDSDDNNQTNNNGGGNEDTTVLATGVTLNKTTLSLIKGGSETLTAIVAPADATDKTLTWASSNTSVATVANGNVTAIGAGTATITVTTANGKTATCEVTVSVLASGVSLNKNNLSLIKGGSETLTATIAPDDTTDKTLTWTSSNESVATVLNGTVTAIGAGTVTITVTTANGKTATCEITVSVLASGVSLNKNNLSLIKGSSETLTASVTPADTTDKTLTWVSSNTSVATVVNGTVTAVGAGTATITVTTANGKIATCEVTVSVLASGVSLNKNNLSLIKGSSETLTATVAPADTTDKTLTWASSNTNVTIVTNGTVTAVGAGTATITVTTANGKTATCDVTVSVLASGVSLNKNTLSLIKGSSETLTATVAPDDTTDKSLTWTTSDANVATVSNGTVTAIGAGTVTITVATANGKTATCEVTVSILASGVSLNKNNLSLIKGRSETLTATVAPEDTTDKTVTWTTSNESVATVLNGTVTAIGAGTVTITVTDSNGHTASCTVTVTVEALGVTLDKNSIQFNVGETNTLTATVAPADTTDKTVTWTTSDASVATISNGIVTAIGSGNATITVTTANGKTATCLVTVIANGISFKTLSVTGTDVYGKVSNTTTTFSFINEIGVSGNATFEVYRDLECENLIRSKTTTINVGDNTFYVLEYVGGEVNALYIVTVRRKPMYTVTFDTKGGTSVPAQTIEEDSFVTVPTTTREGYTFVGWSRDLTLAITDNTEVVAQWTNTPYVVTYDANNGTVASASTTVGYDLTYNLEIPTRTGYTFDGWYYNGNKVASSGTWKIADNVTLEAKWTANADTTYKVEHYIEKLDGTYELKDTDNLAGTSDAEITPDTKNYAGFTAPEKQTVTVLPDGSLVVRYDYTRNSYTITFVTNGGNSINDQDLKYEAAFPTAQRENYTFGGWFKDVNLSNNITTVPNQNITLYAYWTEENKPSDFSYSGTDAITITEYIANVATVVLPTYIGGIPVTVIDTSLFKGCSGLTSITIPNRVTSIGSSAFEDCTGLTSITIPNSVTSIGSSAFYGCSGLKAVHISSIESWCNISFGDYSANPLYYAKNLYLNGELITNLVIPDSVTSIGYSSFSGCRGLTSITIGNSVTSIGKYAFYGCSGLTSITIPDSVTSIGDWAFEGCIGLKAVHISSIESWCNISFGNNSYANPLYYAENLYLNGELITNLVIPDSVTSIGKYAFYGCSGLTSITIGNSVTSIGSAAFYNCSGLTSITIGNSVTGIGSSAFSGCTGLTSITIPNSVMSIGSSAFKDCMGLTSITIPNSVKSIGDGAFYGCSGLTSITIPDSVTSIGSYAFDGCSGLKAVHISSIESWCNISFGNSNANPLYYAKNLYLNGELVTNLVIPDGVTSIGDYAFRNCSGLTSITIPNRVTSIGSFAFEYCIGLKAVHISSIESWCNISFGNNSYANPLYYAENLYLNGELITNLVIPDSVTSIGKYAFYGCSGLTSVTIGNSVTSIGYEAFYNCSGLTSVTIGNSVTSIGKYAFYGCSGLTSITIPDSVTSIGDWAFEGCSGLKAVHISSIESWCNISFGNSNANPLYYAKNLYLNGELVTNLVIPNRVTSIGSYAFYRCSGLTSITISNRVTSIGNYAFDDCYKLVEVINKSSLNIIAGNSSNGYVGYYAKEVHRGESKIVNKDDYLFYSYNGVNYLLGYIGTDTELVLPDDYNGKNYEIYQYAFYECSGLTSITIPDSVTNIGSYAFYRCSGLTSIKYCGTKEEWSNIIKGGCWNEYTGSYTITYNYTGE